jgi:hypothetical protein
MQIKTMMKHHYTFMRMFKIKKWTTQNPGKDAQKLDHLYITGGNVKWQSYFGNQSSTFL